MVRGAAEKWGSYRDAPDRVEGQRVWDLEGEPGACRWPHRADVSRIGGSVRGQGAQQGSGCRRSNGQGAGGGGRDQ